MKNCLQLAVKLTLKMARLNRSHFHVSLQFILLILPEQFDHTPPRSISFLKSIIRNNRGYNLGMLKSFHQHGYKSLWNSTVSHNLMQYGVGLSPSSIIFQLCDELTVIIILTVVTATRWECNLVLGLVFLEMR